jgi:hypothetical protein
LSGLPVSSDVLGALLKAQPEGKQMWISVRGRSMSPLLTGGESLKVQRCSANALRRGDIAVMLRGDGALISHLVVRIRPLRTEGFYGKPDAPGLEVLARAIAIRREEVVIALRPFMRPGLLALQRGWSLAARGRLTQSVYALLGGAVASPRTRRVRALLGAIELRLLGPESLREVAIALSRWVTLSTQSLERLVRDGIAVGAIRRGHLVGLIFVGPDKLLRYGFLQRRAQGMGVELALIERAIGEAAARGMAPIGAELEPPFQGPAEELGLMRPGRR